MQPYRNFEGNSGIKSFKIDEDSITVVFINVTYIFNYAITGERHVEKMKELALLGKGLANYINANVKRTYASKESVW